MEKQENVRPRFSSIQFSYLFLVFIVTLVVIVPALIFLLRHFNILNIPGFGSKKEAARNQTQISGKGEQKDYADGKKIILACPVTLVPCPTGEVFKSQNLGYFGVRYKLSTGTAFLSLINGQYSYVENVKIGETGTKTMSISVVDPETPIRLVYLFNGTPRGELNNGSNVKQGQILGTVKDSEGKAPSFFIFAFGNSGNTRLIPNPDGTLEQISQ